MEIRWHMFSKVHMLLKNLNFRKLIYSIANFTDLIFTDDEQSFNECERNRQSSSRYLIPFSPILFYWFSHIVFVHYSSYQLTHDTRYCMVKSQTNYISRWYLFASRRKDLRGSLRVSLIVIKSLISRSASRYLRWRCARTCTSACTNRLRATLLAALSRPCQV